MKREEYRTGDIVEFLWNNVAKIDFVCKIDGLNHVYMKGKFYAPANWETQVKFVEHDKALEIHEYKHVANQGFQRIM